MCCKDLWYLEVDKPAAPGRVALVKAGTQSLEVNWTGAPQTQTYILQVSIDKLIIKITSLFCYCLETF